MNKKPVMVINWKWRELDHIHTKEKKGQNFHEPTDNQKKELYKEYEVQPSNLYKNAKVIATAIYKDNDENKELAQKLLYAVIGDFVGEDNHLMVFLHRTNGYNEDDVEDLLNYFEGKVNKCFLFADGRDYIYYKTQKAGFLDDSGGFMRQRDIDTGIRVMTYDDVNKIVLQPYFDRVWNYYKGEFESKIFQLKEEIFDQWMPLLLPGKNNEIKQEQLIKLIHEADNQLFYRMKSFLGKYDKETTHANKKDETLQKEQESLRELEKERKVSYIFDDARQNLKYDAKNGKPLVSNVYAEATEELEEILYGNKNKISATTIRKFAHTMEELIRVVPGEID